MKVRVHLCTHLKSMAVHSALTMYAQQLGGSHVAVEIIDVDPNDKSPTVFEAVSPVVRKLALAEWLVEYTPVKTWEFEATAAQAAEIRLELASILGKPYSHFQLVLIGVGSVFRFLDAKLGKVVWNGKMKAICAEVVAIVLECLGYEFKESLDLIDLRDCVRACEELTARKEKPRVDSNP